MNAEKEKELIKLIDEAARFCEVYLNYKPATVAGYRKAWLNILDFMTIYGLDSLDKKSQMKFWDKLNYSKQGKTRHHSWDTKYIIQRAYRMLVSYYETRSIPERFFDSPEKEKFIEPFATYCNDYLQYLSLKLRRSSITVSAYKHSLYQFLRYLGKKKINEIEKLDHSVDPKLYHFFDSRNRCYSFLTNRSYQRFYEISTSYRNNRKRHLCTNASL